ncbi:MAG: alpha/beta hydrolase [Candidatus Bathyarchaeota archaeon]|nr:alpha/beta hydrolase [Candidatus Bathyarchaeota archaeon]
MFTAEGFLEVGKHRIHYATWGQKGGKIVILHSMGMDAYSMEKMCESLSGKYRVLALTILAHGDSSVPAEQVTLPEHAELLRTCIKQLGYAPCVLIGHSIGGRMSMILAAEHPDEVKGLILVDIAPPDPVSRPWSQQAPEAMKNEAEAKAYLRHRYPGFAAEYIESRLRHGFVKQPDGGLKPKPTGSPTMTSYYTDLWPYVEKIRVPAKLVLGSESPLVTPEKRERMAKLIPGLEVVTVKGASHMVPQDRPAEFEGEVRAFLQRLKW